MFSSFSINGFRTFAAFKLSGLARVNLLVGGNNSGKTSLLEALYLLCSSGNPNSFVHLLSRRGEKIVRELNERMDLEIDCRHLFHGHELISGSSFSLRAKRFGQLRELKVTVVDASSSVALDDAPFEMDTASGSLALQLEGNPSPPISLLPLSPQGGLTTRISRLQSVRQQTTTPSSSLPVRFIGTESLSPAELADLWNIIALTPDEDRVINALRLLEPRLERIAPVASGVRMGPSSKGGFLAKLRGMSQPIPFGTMGDGMWRILGLAIALTQSRGGILLVDEIDTGLHHSVMGKMWNLILGTAKELDVQVFATTHSRECVFTLADQAETHHDPNLIAVHRIEAGASSPVHYSLEEIGIAARRELEVR